MDLLSGRMMIGKIAIPVLVESVDVAEGHVINYTVGGDPKK